MGKGAGQYPRSFEHIDGCKGHDGVLLKSGLRLPKNKMQLLKQGSKLGGCADLSCKCQGKSLPCQHRASVLRTGPHVPPTVLFYPCSILQDYKNLGTKPLKCPGSRSPKIQWGQCFCPSFACIVGGWSHPEGRERLVSFYRNMLQLCL